MNALLVFLAGGVFGTLCDEIHVQSGVLAYASPLLLGEAWWVPPEFGLAAMAIYLAGAPVASRLRAASTRRMAADLAWFLGAYALTAIGKEHTAAVGAALVAAFALRMAHARSLPLAIFSLGLAAVGSTYEVLLTATGVYRYLSPDVAGVCFWLPGLYLHTGPLALSYRRTLTLAQS
jgi:hypothetical protein